MKDQHDRNPSTCNAMILPVRDALDVLNGKWKLPILIALSFGIKRFSQLAKEIPAISDRMLSKELRDLEMNQLVKRTVYDTFPVTVEYSMTEYGQSLDKVIEALRSWASSTGNASWRIKNPDEGISDGAFGWL